jgi:hypothetical protein
MTLSRTYFTPLAIRRARQLQVVAASTDSISSPTTKLVRTATPTMATKASSRLAILTIAAGLLRRKLTGREQADMQNEDTLDRALEETFPASDPVSITFKLNSPTFPIVKKLP